MQEETLSMILFSVWCVKQMSDNHNVKLDYFISMLHYAISIN